MRNPYKVHYFGVYFYVGDICIYSLMTYGYDKYEALNKVVQNDDHRIEIIEAVNKATRMEVEKI